MAHSWVSIVGWMTLAFTVGFAWWKGSAAERWGATWVLAMYLASDWAMALAYPRVPEMPLFALDFALAAGLLVLAIRYSSLWLGMAMLLQSAALCAHGLRLAGEFLSAFWWMTLNDVISEMMMLCVVIASAISWRGRSRRAPTPAFELTGERPAA